jgi:signal transduction histidine kinase
MYTHALPHGYIHAKITLMAYRDTRGIGIKKSNVEFRGSRESSDRHWLVVEDGSPQGNRHKSDSVARLSHDIRTQLYIIIGFAELMLDEVPGKINDDQRCNLNDVLNSGRRLVDLLNDIVNQSGSKSGSARDDRTQEEL